MATQTIDQRRAAFAWGRVTERANGGRLPDGYKNSAKAMPALVMTNGLMASLAFLRQKDDHGRNLAQDVLTWVKTELRWTDQEAPATSEQALFQGSMRQLSGLDSLAYMRATEEAFEVLRWIRQFASAI